MEAKRADLIQIDIEAFALIKASLISEAQKGILSDNASFPAEKISDGISDYKSDIEISSEITLNDKKALLCGRILGAFMKDGAYYIDFFLSGKKYRDALDIYSEILAYIILAKKNADKIFIRRIQKEKGDLFIAEREYQKELLCGKFNSYISDISAMLPIFEKKEKSIAFPYKNLRSGQKELMKAVWRAIKSRSALYASAPTGIGKTLAVLYPALKAIETGRAEKIIYLAPKNTLKKQVEKSVMMLQPTENKTKTLILDAKLSLCPEKREECDFYSCPYGLGAKDNMANAVKLLSRNELISSAELGECARICGVCPFEAALAMIKFSDIIICDYNFVFDPRIALSALKGKNSILLIDESHNLPDRIKESYSESIEPSDIDFFFKTESLYNSKLRQYLSMLAERFEIARFDYSNTKRRISKLPDKELFDCAKKVLDGILMIRSLFGEISERENAKTDELIKKLKKFIFLSGIYDDSYRMLNYENGGKKIYPVDISGIIKNVKSNFASQVFFSATLTPADYYAKLLSEDERDESIILPSPFERDNLFIGLCDIDVSFNQRFQNAKKLCSIIISATETKKGNYLIFLPSFEYLDFMVQEYKRISYKNTVIFQKRNMSAADRKSFMDEFSKPRGDTLIAFAVLGGVFGEGIDLAGDKLAGEIIVGTGFPPPSLEKEAESDYFNQADLNGKALAYTLPGFNKVFQAAGRVIRNENDRGFVILCDRRFIGEDIAEIFPESWAPEIITSEKDLSDKLLNFWS